MSKLRNYPEHHVCDDPVRTTEKKVEFATLIWLSSSFSTGFKKSIFYTEVGACVILIWRYLKSFWGTNALGLKNEEHLYYHLVATHITYISVGHRPTLKS